jgi:hypothetical protein
MAEKNENNKNSQKGQVTPKKYLRKLQKTSKKIAVNLLALKSPIEN